MIESHLLKMRRRDTISADEEAAIRGLFTEVRHFAADQVVVAMGQPLTECVLLVDGWLARSRTLSNGERQFTELHVVGDFADLHGFTLRRLEHDVVSITGVTVGIAPHDRVRDLVRRFPRLGEIYWFSTNLDAAIHREWTVSVGSRDALSRMAHLFCELFVRLEIVGKVKAGRFAFPLTQDELASCLSISPVHVNRTLQELRRQELITLEGRELAILDRPRLEQVAQFDPSYLYLTRFSDR